MHIQVNGEPRELPQGLDLEAGLRELGLDPERVAVEHNGAVVRRGGYQEIALQEGDRIEVVRVVGGGAHRRQRRR